MEGKREEGIRKGPWKAEEDQVLLNHVKKCGPKDWSSIRSKGLLQRTGKSCRLRWVNKLRPNLKNGCKFSLEEERVVIELQAQFGNKWAKIATHLAGRTDNDVKNFWSSRQKRLARILQTSTAAITPSKSHKNRREIPVYHDKVPTLEESEYRENPKPFFFKEIPKFSCSSEGESSLQAASCSSRCIGNSEMVPVPELVDSKLLGFEADPVQQELALPAEKNLWIESQPLIPFLENPQPQTDLEFSSDTQELLKLDFDMLTTLDAELSKQLDIGPPFLEPVGNVEGDKIDDPITPDCLFDDFPADMFDQIEPLSHD
ncbi:PREDICTED: transcription factor MYB29-like [Fragaria vesca subsp. vesca]|uniref:transcription factor MYB29-like n=1 Tax=Fragaria vesca subsp. vesca TaxID=101020 RepID=UPI0002C35C85|nr:PREDICTED: transcription factor MYB29-like [Fragaria vesca subsp. vesca]